jgi:ssDNA-binding Zn-finger/Zn-ribbon topoisomerase 1
MGVRKVPFGLKCDKCNKNEMYQTVFNGIQKLACMGFPDCRNIIDIPKNKNVDWINPTDIEPEKPKRAIQKVLKAKR